MYYLQSIRPQNLVIIAITQYLIYYLVVVPVLHNAGIEPLLGDWLFFLLVLDTLLIAAIGNVVNDIFDESTDAVNNKLKIGYIREKAISWLLVLIINAVSISVYVAYQIEHLKLALISIIAIGLLVLYSSHLQKTTLVGNFVVSLFVAFVTGIIWFAERAAYQALGEKDEFQFKYITILLSGYMIFSFVANMYREIIKDIEDVHGDKAANYNTIAVSWGVARAKIVGIFYGGFLLLLEVAWLIGNPLDVNLNVQIAFSLLIIVPTIYALYQTSQARNILQFHKNATLIKIILALGLVYLILLKYL